MTRRLDLGPNLAIAGAVIAGVAIIAGFMIVGGPGHARDQRLDQLTSQKVGQVVGAAQCAFDTSGMAPIDYQSATQTRSTPAPGMPPALCEPTSGMQLKVGAGDTPAAPGDITYQDTGPTQIKVCANFHTQQSREESAQIFPPYSDIYPVLAEGHSAGVHCYVLDLVKSAGQLGPPSPSADPPPKRIP